MGCASIPLSAGDGYISSVMQHLRMQHFSSDVFRVQPLVPLRLADYEHTEDVILPTLLRAYINQGAVVCGDPYGDASFGVADVFVVLDCNKITCRYKKYFMERVEAW